MPYVETSPSDRAAARARAKIRTEPASRPGALPTFPEPETVDRPPTRPLSDGAPGGSTRPPGIRRHQFGIQAPLFADLCDERWPGDPMPEQPLPDPTGMCCSVVRAAAEVLAGMRAPSQLANWVTPQVHDQLVARVKTLRSAVDQGAINPEPRLPIHVRRVRLDRDGDTAEATVILESAGRLRAAAARLEARRGQWRVAVLDLA